MDLKNFFAELKRRHVYRVAVGYAVVAWLVIQVSATVVPALLLPGVITSAVVFAAILGLPIALVLAWAFEVTPEGIRRTEEAGSGSFSRLPLEQQPGRSKTGSRTVVASLAPLRLY